MKSLIEFINESRDIEADNKLTKAIDVLRKQYRIVIKGSTTNSVLIGKTQVDIINSDVCFAWFGASMKIGKEILSGVKFESIPSDVAAQWFKTIALPMEIEDAAGEEEFNPNKLDEMDWVFMDKNSFKSMIELIDDVEDAEESRLNPTGSNSYFNMIYPTNYQDAFNTWKKSTKSDLSDKIYDAMVETWKKIFDYDLK